MNFDRIQPFSKVYIVLISVAIAVLILSAGMAYRQIKRMQESADMVADTYQVNDAIGTLFSHYFRLESEEFREKLLKDDPLEEKLNDYMAYGKIVFDSLQGLVQDNASQMRRLEDIKALEDTLYDKLIFVGDSIDGKTEITDTLTFPIRNFSGTLFKIRIINDQMRAEARRSMRAREADYASQRFLAPFTALVLALFALFVFVFSFLRIYRNKRRLRESDTFLRSVLASTDNIVNYYEPVYDLKGNIRDFTVAFANACNRDYFGVEPENMMDKKISNIFPFVMHNGEFEEMVKSFVTQTKMSYDRQVALNGRKLWFMTIVSPLSKGVLVVSRNATEEEEARENQLALKEQALEDNEKLREAQLFLKNILANTDNVITYFAPVYNDDGQIIDFTIVFNNANIEQVLLKDVAELKNKPISEVYPGHFENGVFEHLVDSCQNDRTVRFENLYTFHGKNFYFKTTAVKLDNGVLTTSSDLTAEQNFKERLKKQNRDLTRSNRELESFNQVVSHDLQEPLRKIQMFVSRINEDNDLTEKKREYFQKIQNAAERMRSLIFNLLNYSRIDSTHDDFEKVDLNAVLDKVREENFVRVQENGATIDAQKLPTINGIFFQMEQLFDNLISNALKYTPSNTPPRITILTEKVHQEEIPEPFFKTAIYYHKLTFADNGIGFEQDKAEKIFQVFQRLHQQSEYSGTGIGLAICKKIVENHHGLILATSEPGRGSVFTVYLPA